VRFEVAKLALHGSAQSSDPEVSKITQNTTAMIAICCTALLLFGHSEGGVLMTIVVMDHVE